MKKRIKILIIFFICIILVLLYSRYIETTGLIVKEIPIKSNIPKEFNGLKVVHLTDLHYGRIINKKELNTLVKSVNLINPDIIIFTGDLIDRDSKIKDYQLLINCLSSINGILGKYAVLGNHDYDYDEKKISEILNKSDFKILKNESKIIYQKDSQIIIHGIDDILNKKNNPSFINSEEQKYQIALVHEPDYVDEILNKSRNINLVLSGHSHNGQVRLPFIGSIYHVNGAKKYYDNHYKINTTDLYISGGIGVSGMNFRLFNKPSINFYRIYSR